MRKRATTQPSLNDTIGLSRFGTSTPEQVAWYWFHESDDYGFLRFLPYLPDGVPYTVETFDCLLKYHQQHRVPKSAPTRWHFEPWFESWLRAINHHEWGDSQLQTMTQAQRKQFARHLAEWLTRLNLQDRAEWLRTCFNEARYNQPRLALLALRVAFELNWNIEFYPDALLALHLLMQTPLESDPNQLVRWVSVRYLARRYRQTRNPQVATRLRSLRNGSERERAFLRRLWHETQPDTPNS